LTLLATISFSIRPLLRELVYLHVSNGLTFMTKYNPLYIRNQSVPRCKHFPPRLHKTNQLMMYKAKVAVCSQIHTKHTM